MRLFELKKILMNPTCCILLSQSKKYPILQFPEIPIPSFHVPLNQRVNFLLCAFASCFYRGERDKVIFSSLRLHFWFQTTKSGKPWRLEPEASLVV